MSVLTTLPTPVVQMGLVEKIVETQQNQPLVQQQMAQEAARGLLNQQRERIEGTEITEHGQKVRERGSGQGRKGRQHKHQAAPEAEQDAEENTGSPSKANPWAGHIVSVKI